MDDPFDIAQLENITETPSDKQLRILDMFASGMHTPEIAKQLHVSPHTVISHKRLIFRALNARSLPNAVAIAMRRGLIK